MKNSKISSIIALLLVSVIAFSSCKKIKIVVVDDTTTETVPTTVFDEWADDEPDDETEKTNDIPTDMPSQSTTDEAVETVAQTSTGGFAVPSGAKEISVRTALRIYRKYFGDIKKDSIGFTKSSWANLTNINLPADPSGLANGIVTVVMQNVIKNTDSDLTVSAKKIPSGSTEIYSEFPIFNNENVEAVADREVIKAAYLVKGEDTATYYVLFEDAFNPVVGVDDFANIMTPFDKDVVTNAITQYLPVADLNSLKFDCNYTGSYMVFTVDTENKCPKSLEQHHYADIDAVVELNLVLVTTNFLNGTCTLEMHYYYYDFEV
ncbi:MAG TPA: hypothetical protein GXZ23_07640 [Clostridiales bacterium]|nr:hypothetical protein [Clostridiales bacterium]